MTSWATAYVAASRLKDAGYQNVGASERMESWYVTFHHDDEAQVPAAYRIVREADPAAQIQTIDN